MSSKTTLKFIDFNVLSKQHIFPSYNTNFLTNLKDIDKEEAIMIYISHNWDRSAVVLSGDDYHSKLQMCIAGISNIWKNLAPGMTKCYVWMDLICSEFETRNNLSHLPEIISSCDLLFTPIYDNDLDVLNSPCGSSNLFKDYSSKEWKDEKSSYLNLALTRFDMFLAANLDIGNSISRLPRFNLALKFHFKDGIRPHFLYGSYEHYSNEPPKVLPSILFSNMKDSFDPCQGYIEDSAIIPLIEAIVKDTPVKSNVNRYNGDRSWKWFGKKHGNGQLIDAEGNKYDGSWVNGKREGYGVFNSINGDIYEGNWKDNVKNGYGVYLFANGDCYRGHFKDGLRDGISGTYVYTSSSGQYEGGWSKGMKEGKGKMSFTDGRYYDGMWSNDMKEGYGIACYGDGRKYEGDWHKGQMHGNGKATYYDGGVYEGVWKEDKRHGQGKMSFADGSVWEGIWNTDRIQDRHGGWSIDGQPFCPDISTVFLAMSMSQFNNGTTSKYDC
eukprot:gene4723-6628_t